MEHKDLTNEKLLKKFESQFKLVEYAIGEAKHMVLAGKEGRADNQNVALEVLEDLNDQADSSTLREFFRVKAEVIPEELDIDFIKL